LDKTEPITTLGPYKSLGDAGEAEIGARASGKIPLERFQHALSIFDWNKIYRCGLWTHFVHDTFHPGIIFPDLEGVD
jgi:hypothetical protein